MPAGEIENAVVNQIRALLRTPEIVVRIWRAVRQTTDDMTEAVVRAALQQFDELREELFPAEQASIVQLLTERVDVGLDGVDIRLRFEGLTSLVADLSVAKAEMRRAA